MSLIHEALEKVEQEKKQEAPSAPEAVPVERRVKKGSRGPVYAVAGILVFFSVLGGVYLVVRSLPPPSGDREALSSSSLPPLVRRTFLSPASDVRFSLTGITRMGTEATAIINNQLVRVGETVDGATVKSIQEDEVMLEFRGQTLRLRLHG